MPTTPLTPLALKGAPSLIERVFPAQKVSAEAQKERKAGAGQTLTALGVYWKGRKPLIMVRAIVLGCLLPVTDDLEADLHIFELLMAMDDAAFGRREPKLKVVEIAQRIRLANPWDFFDYTNKFYDADEIEALELPLDAAAYPKLKLRWQRGLGDEQKHQQETMQDVDLAIAEQEALHDLINALKGMQGEDPKLKAVKHYLAQENWVQHGCIIFSQYYDTAAWVAENLAALFPDQLIGLYAGADKSALFRGPENPNRAKRETLKKMVEDQAIRIMVATDAACEGLNLQRLGTLINVDLPWNPTRLEQRIGRIKRFGQTRPTVDRLNLVYQSTVDENIYERLSARM
ncbi:MAG: DUF1156 domain-containing protein, partial [Phormidesmis sp.]